MLWIGIHLPRLPLETLLRGSPRPEAWAVVERERIVLADRKARSRGVREGMLVTAALALAPQLRTLVRDAAAETESLLGIAAWAAQFTPSVALDFPAGLALEVEGSLKIFGGLENILTRVREGLDAMGYSATVAAAPVAKAAGWLACSGTNGVIDASALRPSVEALPVSLLRCDEETLRALNALGVSTMGDLLALPREGIGRRFGQELLDELDRGLGTLADPRSYFVPPPRFHAVLELPAEVTHAEALLFAGRRLLTQLEGYLAARCGGVQRFNFRLAHREGPATEVTVGLVAPSRDSSHFALLLREQLGRLVLRDPVRSLVLQASDVMPLAGTAQSLLAEDKSAPGDWPRLIEKLRSRLGSESVQAIVATADHRPEKASRAHDPASKQLRLELPQPPGERPFWLLDAPRPLEEIGAAPHYTGPLTLLAGPERIEAGWWDGEEAARDYFIARTPDDSLVWVYREPARGWFLHGLFA
jgi:protein ImuB